MAKNVYNERRRKGGFGMTYLAAVIQLDTGKNVDDNWEQAEHLIRQAAAKGAKLVVLPEHAV